MRTTDNNIILSYICDNCDKTFLTKEKIDIHKSVHSTRRDFICLQCNSAFKSNCELNMHRRTVHWESKYIFDECEMTTNLHVNLFRHINSYHQCISNRCGKTFKLSSIAWNNISNSFHSNNPNKCQCNRCGNVSLYKKIIDTTLIRWMCFAAIDVRKRT